MDTRYLENLSTIKCNYLIKNNKEKIILASGEIARNDLAPACPDEVKGRG
jgi:hypothetical protein